MRYVLILSHFSDILGHSDVRLFFFCNATEFVIFDWYVLFEVKLIIACTQITTGKNDKGLKLYDPGYINTAPVRSSICYIDGDEGILRYRGYPIEQLAEGSSFVEVAYLLSNTSYRTICYYSFSVKVTQSWRHINLVCDFCFLESCKS